MARRRIQLGTAAAAVAAALSVALMGCGAPEPSNGGDASRPTSPQGQSSGESPADPTQETGGGGKTVTSETPAGDSETGTGQASADAAAGNDGTDRLGTYESLTNLTADMVPKAAIYPSGSSSDDIAAAVVSHMGKRHEGLKVKGVQLKGNGWDMSTGKEGVSSWATYLLDTDGGDIGVRVICQASGTLLVSEPDVLKIDGENGYDVQSKTIVSLSSVTPGSPGDELVDYDDVYPVWESMTADDLPPYQVVPVQKADGSTVNVVITGTGE